MGECVTVEISLIVSLVGAVLSAVSFCIGRMTAAKQNGRESGALSVEIGYIKKGVDDIQKKIDRSEEQVHALAERVRTLEAQMKVYHGGGK